MDARSIAKLMNLSPEKTERLTQAWQQAQLVAQGVTTQQDALAALNANGIDGSFISKVSGYLNHPLAGMLAKGAGLNLEKIRSDFSSLQQATAGVTAAASAAPSTAGASGDMLSTFRQGLQQLK